MFILKLWVSAVFDKVNNVLSVFLQMLQLLLAGKKLIQKVKINYSYTCVKC